MDAMTLATMVAEPETFGKEDLDRWVRVIDYSTIANQFAKYVVARSAPAPWAVTKWTKAKRPFVAIAGWDVVSCLAMEEDGGSLDLLELLGRIEAEIARPTDSGQARHEQFHDRHRPAQQGAAKKGDRRGETNRPGGGRSWPDGL
ncbi:MAG: hypothetical protein QGG05_01800 [Candidatus Latescibacteria bacterium]|nr:hypothetical protein [Candidatus Latescibacterota bacterium]